MDRSLPVSGSGRWATHSKDQQLLDRVLVDIRDQSQQLSPGSPFRLYDDGKSEASFRGGTTLRDLIGRRPVPSPGCFR